MLWHDDLLLLNIVVLVLALFLGPLQAGEAAAQRLQHFLGEVTAATLSGLVLSEHLLFVLRQLLSLQFLDTDQVIVAAKSVGTQTTLRR